MTTNPIPRCITRRERFNATIRTILARLEAEAKATTDNAQQGAESPATARD